MKKKLFWGYTFTIVSACLYGCMALITKNLYAQGVNVGAMVLFQQGARTTGSQRAAILSTLEPVVSVLVGQWAFREIIGGRTVIGSALVLLASILITLFDAKKKTEVE